MILHMLFFTWSTEGGGGSLIVLEGQSVGKWSWKVLDLSLIGAAGNVS